MATANTAAQVFRQHYAALAESIQDTDTLALQLYVSNIISRDVREEVIRNTLTRQQKNTGLLAVVETQVATNPHAFDVFLRLLKERPELAPLCGRIEMYYHPPPAIVVTRARVNDNTFPYLDMGSMNEEQRLNLQGRLLRECDDIIFRFCELIFHAIQSLTTNGVSVVSLRITLANLGTYTSVRNHAALLQDQMERLRRAQTIEEIFDILSDYYSFFNYGLVEMIIRQFGTPDDRERLDTYIRHFRQFCTRRTFQCPPNIFGRTVESGRSVLVVKVEQTWDPQEGGNLDQVLRLRNTLADILGVLPETLYLWRIDRGCVELLFQVPGFVERDVFPLSAGQESRITSTGITKLACVGTETPTSPSVSQVGTETPTSPSVSDALQNTNEIDTGSRKRTGEALGTQTPTKRLKNQESKQQSATSSSERKPPTEAGGVSNHSQLLMNTRVSSNQSEVSTSTKKNYPHRCQQCTGCRSADCGECVNCKAKTKFGGPGGLYRYCVKRKCEAQSRRPNPLSGGITRASPPLQCSSSSVPDEFEPPPSKAPKLQDDLGSKNEAAETHTGTGNEAQNLGETGSEQDELCGLLQQVVQKMQKQITKLKEELKAKEKELSQLQEAKGEIVQQRAKEVKEKDAIIAQLEAVARQHRERVLEEEKEVIQLKAETKLYAKQLREREEEIAQLKVETHKEKQQIMQLETTINQQDGRLKQQSEQLRQAGTEQATKIQENEQKILQLQVAAVQKSHRLQQLEAANKVQEQKVQEKDQEIAKMKGTCSQSAQLMKTVEQRMQTVEQQLKASEEKDLKILQLEVAVSQHVAKMKEKEQELTQAKQASNISEQLKRRADQQWKTQQEGQQKIQQLESTCKQHQLQLQQKEQKITKLLDANKEQINNLSEREGELLRLREDIQRLKGNDDELTQLRRLSKQQTSKIQEQQKRLQDGEKELVQLRESGKKEVQLKLQNQERKIKEWLMAIPVQGFGIIDAQPEYSLQ